MFLIQLRKKTIFRRTNLQKYNPDRVQRTLSGLYFTIWPLLLFVNFEFEIININTALASFP